MSDSLTAAVVLRTPLDTLVLRCPAGAPMLRAALDFCSQIPEENVPSSMQNRVIQALVRNYDQLQISGEKDLLKRKPVGFPVLEFSFWEEKTISRIRVLSRDGQRAIHCFDLPLRSQGEKALLLLTLQGNDRTYEAMQRAAQDIELILAGKSTYNHLGFIGATEKILSELLHCTQEPQTEKLQALCPFQDNYQGAESRQRINTLARTLDRLENTAKCVTREGSLVSSELIFEFHRQIRDLHGHAYRAVTCILHGAQSDRMKTRPYRLPLVGALDTEEEKPPITQRWGETLCRLVRAEYPRSRAQAGELDDLLQDFLRQSLEFLPEPKPEVTDTLLFGYGEALKEVRLSPTHAMVLVEWARTVPERDTHQDAKAREILGVMELGFQR